MAQKLRPGIADACFECCPSCDESRLNLPYELMSWIWNACHDALYYGASSGYDDSCYRSYCVADWFD